MNTLQVLIPKLLDGLTSFGFQLSKRNKSVLLLPLKCTLIYFLSVYLAMSCIPVYLFKIQLIQKSVQIKQVNYSYNESGSKSLKFQKV